MKKSFLWVPLVAASGLLPGCISKGDTNIGGDKEESSRADDDDDADAGGDDDESSKPNDDDADDDTTSDDDATDDDVTEPADDDVPMEEPEPEMAEPAPEPQAEPDASTSNGGSGAGTGGTPAEPDGAAGETGAGGAAGGAGGAEEPDVMSTACDGTAKTPVNSLSLSLDIADSSAMTGLGVDFDGEKFIVAWISGADLVRFAAVDTDGAVDGPWDLARGEAETLDTADVRVVASGGRTGAFDTLIAWQDIGTPTANGTGFELYGNWVASDGTQELAAAFPIASGSHGSINPRFDAAWLDVDGAGTYGLGLADRVILMSETGDTVTAAGGFGQFVAMAPRETDFLTLTSDGGPGRRLAHSETEPAANIVSISDALTTAGGGCGDHDDPSSCSTRMVWSGPGTNEAWVVGGPLATLQRFTVDGSPVGTDVALGVATSRVLDARYHAGSDTVGVLLMQDSNTETVRVALRRGDFSVVADAGSLGRSNDTHSGQLVWAGEDLYAFWLARPEGGGARRIYMTQVLCR